MSRETILIVDDEPAFARVAGAFLSREGYHIVTAKDAASAREVFVQARPDLVLPDLFMPPEGTMPCTEPARVAGHLSRSFARNSRQIDRERIIRPSQRRPFTGARADRAGLVAAARGGTLFLDEIGETPLPMQVKLCRFLQEGTLRRSERAKRDTPMFASSAPRIAISRR